MTTSGWEDILDKDEKILWQGRPDAGIHLKIGNIATFGFGLVFAGFALFWMIMAAQGGGGLWMFGLIHFSVGISMSFGPVFWSAYTRRHSWYTLTNGRAFIAVDTPIKGRSLKSYPINQDTVLEYNQGPLATIYFSEIIKRGNKGRRYSVQIGFERISEGDEVYRLMRRVQYDAKQAQETT